MDLIVSKCYVVLVDGVPFLKLNLLPIRTSLCGDELLEIANGVVWAAFDTHFASQAIVSDYFDESHVCASYGLYEVI